jgi:hypothetical protein
VPLHGQLVVWRSAALRIVDRTKVSLLICLAFFTLCHLRMNL